MNEEIFKLDVSKQYHNYNISKIPTPNSAYSWKNLKCNKRNKAKKRGRK